MVTCQSNLETKQDRMESDPSQPPTVLPSACPSPYEPLSQHVDCTRLVKIEPAKRNDDSVICSLFEVAFGDRPKFDALSYMWGDGPARCSIILNGVTFSVRQNLIDALRCLQTHAPDTCYWIDAICINQDDIPERNRQVKTMHHIYSRAKTVVVWLGERYAEYEASLPDLHRLSHCKPSNRQPKLEQSPDEPQSHLPTAKLPDEDGKQREMALKLYNDDYWSRLWIIQEIGLAREIKVCFGNSAVEWSQFILFIAMHNIGGDGPARLNRQREERHNGSSTLLKLLQSHKDALCEDRKDKVYGLVGLASDARSFVIDYEKSNFEIWTDVMEFINRHDLFAREDIVSVGDLVKSLLIGPNCPPLQQVLRSYAPGKEDRMIITDPNHYKAFELQAAMLGCVICVGPHPNEIVGSLKKVDEWVEQVQANYRQDLNRAHWESDILIQAILDLDDISLSKKCPEYRSIVQWSVEDVRSANNDALGYHDHQIQDLQSKSSGQFENKTSSEEQSSTNNSRLFQMLNSYLGQTPWKMGIASSDIRSGDLICWLRQPRRAVVVRPQWQGEGYRYVWKLQVVGTAVITEDLRLSSLSGSQRPDWSKNKSSLTIYLDASTIFILLA